ncbi:MAG: UDP-N-acetylmuramoyl-tripeptide--D-alanyl-D-alanine ligase, partial [Chloroflexi bacterium]|nr:UDP-N-acetylmuramoyl-tripeptide--D-alanyl-D-alanine ligase [Chloroflexota bacterium]
MTGILEASLLLGGLAIWATLYLVRLRGFLHICQLEEYFTAAYAAWLWRHPSRHLHARLLLVGVLPAVVAAAAIWTPIPTEGRSAFVTVWGLAGSALLVLRQRRTARKALTFTARARRLYAAATGLGLGPPWATAFWALTREPGSDTGQAQAAAILLMAGATLLGGGLLALANLLLFPLEEAARYRYARAATAIVRARRPRIIAITGSAGKTTTKEILHALLSPRYKVLRTPASFNTPMGITRVIRESLTDQEIFIVEMGAYKRGDIATLCRLVGAPDIAIVTQINEQHLERFGSLENTVRAKFECVAALRPEGTAILNFDNPHIRACGDAPPPPRLIRYGTDPDAPLDLRARNVVTGPEGTSFELAWTGQPCVAVRTSLLGNHNVLNTLAAAGAAHL